MVEVQVVYWRDIPAQVKGRDGQARAGAGLPDRFQEAIDAAAMRAGLTDTEDYLGEWRGSAWESSDQALEAAVEARAGALEAAYPDERLRALVDNGGRER
jgi:hypothetical protein